jgi:four helix bundle protein
MTSQTRRSAASIAANIAEGYGREHRDSFVQFLRISLKELETHVILSGRLRFMAETGVAKMLGHSDELGRMLRAMIRSPAAEAMTRQSHYSLLTTHYSLDPRAT